MTISEKIFELLRQKGMTQREFSELTDIGQSTISDWKRKKTNPSADKILIICSILGTTPEELLSGTDRVKIKGREDEAYVINKNSELGKMITSYESMSVLQKNRLLGYFHALVSDTEDAMQEAGNNTVGKSG